MARRMKYKQNVAYELRFLDHFCGHDDITIVVFIGYFIKETDKAYVFSHWVLEENNKDREHNYEFSAIIKDSILSSHEIKSPVPLQ